jgi:hypothetical protein
VVAILSAIYLRIPGRRRAVPPSCLWGSVYLSIGMGKVCDTLRPTRKIQDCPPRCLLTCRRVQYLQISGGRRVVLLEVTQDRYTGDVSCCLILVTCRCSVSVVTRAKSLSLTEKLISITVVNYPMAEPDIICSTYWTLTASSH